MHSLSAQSEVSVSNPRIVHPTRSGEGNPLMEPQCMEHENVSPVQSHAKCHIRVEHAIIYPFFFSSRGG